MDAFLFYSKEDIISLGIEETLLNSLTQVTIVEAFQDSFSDSPTKGLYINKEVFKNKIVLKEISKGNEDSYPFVEIYYNNDDNSLISVYKISDDIFFILENVHIG